MGIVCKKRNPTQFPSDPNAPKRAPSAFFLFGASVRPALQKKLKGKPVSAVAKAIGEQWKKISDSEKAKFEKKATAAKKAVEASRKKYEKTTSFKNYQAAKKEFLKQKKALGKEQKEIRKDHVLQKLPSREEGIFKAEKSSWKGAKLKNISKLKSRSF